MVILCIMSMVRKRKQKSNKVYKFYLTCLYVILVISRFGFEGVVWVLVAPVTIHSLLVAFIKHSMYVCMYVCTYVRTGDRSLPLWLLVRFKS